ncbi:MAG: sigma-70 family RNA polymerase sigma factor [Bacteroidales bacterium]|nr:sigma-70 family RNA polymerase sigma factor [Bacteroidales bacterium]
MRQLKIVKQLTNRSSLPIEKYLQDITKYPLISAEEEVTLAQKIREGDKTALEKLTKANLRFVVSVAKQYQNQGLTLADLINEGNLGLIKAATKFDETKGFKFISYAVWWIRQAILQAIAEQSRIVRLPLNRINTINKIKKTFSELEQQYEREPSANEIADKLETTEYEVKESMRIRQRHFSMDTPLVEGEDRNWYEVMSDDEVPNPDHILIRESLRSEIETLLKSLSKREAEVVKYFYGLNGGPPLSHIEIGEKLDLTAERVRQIKENAIKKLKSSSKSKFLKKYLS